MLIHSLLLTWKNGFNDIFLMEIENDMNANEKMIFGICEDNVEEAKWLEKIILNWGRMHCHTIEVQKFENAQHFWFAYEAGNLQAIFLDIKMPGEDGVLLAKKLRQRKDTVPIVFVTGEKEYILEGYEVEAVHYLLKPVDKKKVYECLDRIEQKLKIAAPYIVLDTEGETVKIVQKDIYKIEAFSHKLRYTTKKGDFEIYASLKEAQRELVKGWFVLCYRGILVNLWHVDRIEKNRLLLSDNEKDDFVIEVPISRRMYVEVNEAFITFYQGKINL